jgi:FKBP-type peptidyl-prolyl cis-trans isomerase
MASISHRIFAGFFAGLFLLSSSVLTIAIIWQATHGNKTPEDTAASQTSKEKKDMLQGTQLANYTPGTPIPALKSEDTTPGTGAEAKAGDTVTVDYTGAVAATGVIFQSSKDTGQPVSFPLNQVIAGWSQGVPGMKEGGTRRLYIPAPLAYGANPPAGSGIPANADLVFDITLHKVGQ